MPSITVWTRLEPDTSPSDLGYDTATRDRLVSLGVQARVYDPLWLLGRQWQFGEFQGEDAGSPIQANLRVESTPITAFTSSVPAAGSTITGQLYARHPATNAPVVPLEALVEAERIQIGDRPGLRQAAEVGIRLIRMLIDAGFARYRAAFLKTYPLPVVSENTLDASSAILQRMVAGRAIDGAALRRELRAYNPPESTKPFGFPPGVGVSLADRPLMATVLTNWLTWYEAGLVTEPAASASWVPERMEYRFAVAAPPLAGEQEAVLAAPSYGGDLDWHSFDRLNGSTATSLSATGTAQLSPSVSLIPSKVRYPGMPSSRFWEFEDAHVDLGAVDAQPGDLARLLLLEFALTYGNDWFVLPVDIVSGTLCRVASLDIVDTFGQHRAISAASEGEPGRRSRLFRLTDTAGDVTREALFIPPVLATTLESGPVEQVRFAHDEMANMVWAIERAVESPAGWPLDLHRTEPVRPGSDVAAANDLEYCLMSTLPRNWLPLMPADPAAPPPLKLTLGAALVDGVVTPSAPRGRVVSQDLALAAEEVPRDGLDVARLYRYARWVDGSTRVWAARRRRPASGEVSSALQFDFFRQS